jgi:signal transduction histidine kinase
VEASKASTGNLPVDMELTEVGTILEQAVGEYDERLKQNQLETVLLREEEEVYIMADGRLLWRVLDNLMSNVCKYGMPGTRFYVTLVAREKDVFIILRNISKYPLNISSEELMSRFVRGDESRHTEGSGLGLSIAQSLTQLQRGSVELKVDGDLFKVILKFPRQYVNNKEE